MQSGKLVRFFFVYTIIGLLGSYIIVTLFPNLLEKNHAQVEIKQVMPGSFSNGSPDNRPVKLYPVRDFLCRTVLCRP